MFKLFELAEGGRAIQIDLLVSFCKGWKPPSSLLFMTSFAYVGGKDIRVSYILAIILWKGKGLRSSCGIARKRIR